MAKELIRTVIADDENPARESLRQLLQAFEAIKIVAECKNGFEVIQTVREKKPDLLFLDIQMPKLDGFDVLELLGDEAPVVIFVTAYDEFALRAFDTFAVDYLLKPVKPERLATALERAEERFRLSQLERYIQLTRNHQTAQRPIQRICVREQTVVQIIPVTEIICIEAQEDYINIISVKGEYLKNDQLSRIEALLDEGVFCRIHRSYLININFLDRIESLTKDRRIAVLKNKKKLPISRSGYDRLTAFIQP
jgi:two-component system LytT family response regulator